MKKFEIEHLKSRVNEVVKCTNGQVSTRLNRKKKGTGLTDRRKLKMIRSGKAILKDDFDLGEMQNNYSSVPIVRELFKCYDFPTTESQQEKINYNKSLDDRMEEIHTEIELEGKRLVDRAVLNIIPVESFPDELRKLGEMVKLADG